jgi:hypothetical protein
LRSRKTAISFPIARQEGILVETVGEESVVYDLQTKDVHCLSALAAAVFALADGRTTSTDIAELASYRLGRPVGEAEVADAVSQLESRSLLDQPPAVEGVSRRQALRTFAAAGVGAALITTIAAPTALAATSQVPTGDCCGDSTKTNCAGLNSICSSGHCCQDNGGKSCNQCKCVGLKNDCDTKSTGCTVTPNNCPSGQSCVKLSDGTTACCTVFVAPGGGVLNC